MRLAFTCPAYLPSRGGVETHVAQLARRLAARGHSVEILTERRERGLPSVDTLDGVAVRRFDVPFPSQRYAFSPALWNFVIRHGREYDILHAQNYHAFSSIAASLAPFAHLVCTPHYHGTGHTALGRLLHVPYRRAGYWMLHRARAIICVSRMEAALVRAHFPSAGERISVIPNGVDVDPFRAAEPFALDGMVVLSVGRLLAYKHVDRAIEALAALDDTYQLVVVGDGPARSSLDSLARRLHVTNRVNFVGNVVDGTLRRWYRTASAYVSMSEGEAFGLTLLEALAAGAPVVASDIPAHREVRDLVGVSPIALVPLDADPVRIAQAITDAVKFPRPVSVGRLPTWEAVVDETEAVYARVAAGVR